MNKSYKLRYVAFLDILGFKDIVIKSEKYEIEFLKIRNLFKSFEHLKHQVSNDEKSVDEIGLLFPDLVGKISTPTMTSFSDCVVFTSENLRGGGIISILEIVSQFCAASLALGYLVRGGISVGPIFHENSNVFGPALIEAYKLESEKAVFPRVILSSQVARDVDRIKPTFAISGENSVLKDTDDISYVHILAHEIKLSGQNTYFEQVRHNLLQMLSECKNQKHVEKVEWAVNYFNASITAFGRSHGLETKPIDLKWGNFD